MSYEIRVHIGSSDKPLNQVTNDWITQEINNRKRDGQNVCVKVTINGDGVNIVLSSLDCATGRRGGRRPNKKEQKLFSLWKKRGMKNDNIVPGSLISFLNQFSHYI